MRKKSFFCPCGKNLFFRSKYEGKKISTKEYTKKEYGLKLLFLTNYTIYPYKEEDFARPLFGLASTRRFLKVDNRLICGSNSKTNLLSNTFFKILSRFLLK
jgi:hypothetical protein